MWGTRCNLWAGIVVILLVAVKGAVKDAATQTSPTDPPAPRQNSSGGCLQVLKPSDKPISFAQNTPREHILSQLTRKLVEGARKLDKESSSLSIETAGEDVGFHVIRARSATGNHPCFEMAYEIVDVDECADPSFRACHPSARCRNTNGSYECDCPSGMVGQEGPCAGLNTTATQGCNCQTPKCKLSLRCAVPDACGGRCVPEAGCEKGKCVCPSGLFGSGVRCHNKQRLEALFDRNGTLYGPSQMEDDYCGCQPRRVDYCIGVVCRAHSVCQTVGNGYMCTCEEGFVEGEGGECVDPKGIRLVLQGEARVVVEQGDAFVDPWVRIKDENRMGEKSRSIGVDYDDAFSKDTLDEVGEYKVVYSVVANWTTQKKVTATRTVVVRDINECRLSTNHPKYAKWHHMCDPPASCNNTIGAYECHCPPGSVGDGALPLAENQRRPGNFRNGSGCVDIRPPVIELTPRQGPRVLTVCKCEGLAGGASPACPRRDYRQELQTLLDRDRSFLCPAGVPQCMRAYKPQWASQVDLTKSIVMGPVEAVKSDGAAHLFRVPLDVSGPKGSRAETKYAEILVEEVPLSKLRAGADKAPPSPARALESVSGELEECRRANGQLEKRIQALEAEKQRLQRAAVPPSPTPGPSGNGPPANETRREGEQRRHIAQLEQQLSACKDTQGGSCPFPPAPFPEAKEEGLSWWVGAGFVLFVISCVMGYCCLQQRATEAGRPPHPSNARYQENPSPAHTRALDRTPGSPVRPLRGHVNLGTRTPLMSPPGTR